MSARRAHRPRHRAAVGLRRSSPAAVVKLRRGRHAARSSLATLLSVLLALTGVSAGAVINAAAASAAPVYEITGQWAPGTPGTVAKGDVVTGVWHVNVNDDQPAPANDPVDNVTFTVTLGHGKFQSIPDGCLTSGVDPASTISSDGAVLTCNVGTKVEGTAVVVQAPVLADGATGDDLTATGEIDGHSVPLQKIPTSNPFGMDIAWGASTNTVVTNADGSSSVNLEWTLFAAAGSDPGPTSVSYTLTITAGDGTASLPTAAQLPAGESRCDAFTSGSASGHPWSGGGNPDEQTAPFPGSCTLTHLTGDQYQLTLSGIDYSQTEVPSEDSAGQSLPTDQAAIASGKIWVTVTGGSANNSVSLSSDAPTYTSSGGGQTATDDASNNTTSKTWATGNWSNEYRPAQSGSSLGFWTGQYRVSAGTVVTATTSTSFGHSSYPAEAAFGQCVILDPRYETFVDYDFTYNYANPPTPNTAIPGSTVEYYTGASALLNPASASYDPNSFHCDTNPAGWTTTPPADPSTVKAVRVTYPFSVIAGSNNSVLDVHARINDDAPIGQDIWEFGETMVDGGAWRQNNRSTDPADASPGAVLTPGHRYPGSGRDVLYVIGVTPAVSKSVDHTTLAPGEPASYTLTYSANGTGAIPPTVDDYQLVDTLPAGMTYVDGTATPAPTITTSGGQQVLTWTLDGVPTNSQQVLTYQAVADDTVTPGQVLTNDVTAEVDDQTTAPATASVVVPTSGYTTIAKTADEQYIPNVDGNGDGSGSWTVTLRSFDPLPQDYTDTIDILPYKGDSRGTTYHGTYTLQPVTAVSGATVYYTSADPSTLSDDPGDPSNGAPGDPTGNTVGWTTTYTADATAVRVVGPALAPSAAQQFTVPITTDGAQGGDVLVNRAQARDEHTQLVMRTSAPITVANFYSATLKKYVQDDDGVWHDANAAADFPTFRYGDTVHYRVVVTNTGQGTLHDIDVSDDKQPTLGAFHIDSLAPSASQTHEYSITLGTDATGPVINTACAGAATPPDVTTAPAIPCDPAGFDIVNYTTTKSVSPSGPVQPGTVLHYTVTLTQAGSVPADAVFADDLSQDLDDATYNNDAAASLGKLTYTAPTLSWSGTIPVGGTATVTYSLTVDKVDASDPGELAGGGNTSLDNTVTSPGCVPQNGQTPDCTTHTPIHWYTYSKVADPTSGSAVGVGDKVTYTITITEHGTAAFDGASVTDDLTDVLDDATYDKDSKASSGAVSVSGSTLSWRGDLALGQKVTITYSVTVTGAGSDDLVNPVTSPVGYCDTAVGCKPENPVGDYDFSKTADPKSGSTVHVGDKVTYTVTIVQHGKAAVPHATVNDDMSDVLDDATYDGDARASAGVVSFSSPTLSWLGDLAVGQTVTITYSVTVTAKGNQHLANVVTTPDHRGTCDTAIGCATHHDVPDPTLAPVSAGSSGLASTGNDTRLELILVGLLLAGGAVLSIVGGRRRRRAS